MLLNQSIRPPYKLWRVRHSVINLSCSGLKNGALVRTCQNELCDGFYNLSGKVYNPLYMGDNLLIYPCRAVWQWKDHPSSSASSNNLPACRNDTEHKEDTLICWSWHKGTEIIHDMHVVNTDTLSYPKKLRDKFLLTAEKEQNGNTLRPASSSAVTSRLSFFFGMLVVES